jgi:hypothetical protein
MASGVGGGSAEAGVGAESAGAFAALDPNVPNPVVVVREEVPKPDRRPANAGMADWVHDMADFESVDDGVQKKATPIRFSEGIS